MMYIIDKIIKKTEDSSNDWRNGSSGNRKLSIQQKDYDAVGRSVLNEELLHLENKHLIKVKWWSKPHEAEYISYRLENLPVFYDLKRNEMEAESDFSFTTKAERIYVYRNMIQNTIAAGVQQDWIQRYFMWLLQKLEEGKEVRDLESLEEYLPVLKAIDQLNEPVLKNEFSEKFLGEPKKFQREMENHIVTLFKKYTDGIDSAISNKKVLEILLIEDDMKEMEIKKALKAGGVNKLLFHPTDEEYKTLLEMYDAVENSSGTSKEVGDSLEKLVQYLFNLCDGFEAKGIRTPLNQIDCCVHNKLYLKYGIFNTIGGHFFIECKNEKRTPSGDVFLKFESVIANRNSAGMAETVKFGIIISKERGPETFRDNAGIAYFTRGIVIISICGEELKQLFEEKGNLLDLIEEKVFEVTGRGKLRF